MHSPSPPRFGSLQLTYDVSRNAREGHVGLCLKKACFDLPGNEDEISLNGRVIAKNSDVADLSRELEIGNPDSKRIDEMTQALYRVLHRLKLLNPDADVEFYNHGVKSGGPLKDIWNFRLRSIFDRFCHVSRVQPFGVDALGNLSKSTKMQETAGMTDLKIDDPLSGNQLKPKLPLPGLKFELRPDDNLKKRYKN